MPENETKIFRDFYEIYEKYRSVVLKYDEEWKALVDELTACAMVNNWEGCPLAKNMFNMILDTFNDMYRNGKQPAIVTESNYFGRDDL